MTVDKLPLVLEPRPAGGSGCVSVGVELTADRQLPNNLWLNAFAFVGGFSDRFANAIINRIMVVFLGESSEEKKDGAEPADTKE